MEADYEIMIEIDWMVHSYLLTQEMVVFAGKYPDRADAEWQRYVLGAMERVIKAVRLGKVQVMGDYDLVWHEYMVSHARWQVARYARVIDDVEFYVACARLRNTRDLKLRAIQKGHSLKAG